MIFFILLKNTPAIGYTPTQMNCLHTSDDIWVVGR